MMGTLEKNSELNDLRIMAGKVCMVTGATAGIGKVTATALTDLGAHLVITGRNPQKTKESARIVNVSSDAHKQACMDFDDLRLTKRYFGMKTYGRSKLANILFTYELERRLKDNNVTVNALHPGHVATQTSN